MLAATPDSPTACTLGGVITVLTGPTAKADVLRLAAAAPAATAVLLSPPPLDDDRTLAVQMIESAQLHGQPEPTDLGDFAVDLLSAELLLDRVPRPMSRGERQICGLLILLARPFESLVLVEPTAALDGTRRRIVADLLIDLDEDGITIVVATNDLDVIERVSSTRR